MLSSFSSTLFCPPIFSSSNTFTAFNSNTKFTFIRIQTIHFRKFKASSSMNYSNLSTMSDTENTEFNQVKSNHNLNDQMMESTPYIPPVWANHLQLIPKQKISLARIPTPIHEWDVPGLPEGVKLWIKRDDLSGMQLSGNKIRKLEFLLSHAKSNGHDCVITIGGIQSNHCRATAVASRFVGLDSHLILRTNRTSVDKDPGLDGNLLIERLIGANIELVSKEEYVQYGSERLCQILESKLKKQNLNPYVIPVGGSNAIGTWGYIEAMNEIEVQLETGSCHGASHFDDIAFACGSGGTAAGIALGNHLSKRLNANVHAFGVCDDPNYFYDSIQNLIDEVIGEKGIVDSKNVINMIDVKGMGYALSKTEELEFMVSVAKKTGIVLDPVYTGKALKGLVDEMNKAPEKWTGKNVLFIHTGGLLGMYEKVTQLLPLVGQVHRMNLD